MEVREILIGLIQSAVGGCARHWAELIADKLIANGVTMQPIQPEKKQYDISEGIFTLEEARAILLPLPVPPKEG